MLNHIWFALQRKYCAALLRVRVCSKTGDRFGFPGVMPQSVSWGWTLELSVNVECCISSRVLGPGSRVEFVVGCRVYGRSVCSDLVGLQWLSWILGSGFERQHTLCFQTPATSLGLTFVIFCNLFAHRLSCHCPWGSEARLFVISGCNHIPMEPLQLQLQMSSSKLYTLKSYRM